MRRFVLGLALFAATSSVIAQQAATPAPAANAPAASAPASTQRTQQEIVKEIQAASGDLRKAIPNAEAFTTAAGRKAAAPQAIPALKKMQKLFDELAAAEPQAKGAGGQITTMLLVFGDADTIAQAKKVAAGSGVDAAAAQAQLASADYITAQTAAEQNKAIDDFAKALKTDKQSIQLMGIFMGTKALDPSVSDHLLAMVKENAPAGAKEQIVAQMEGEKKLNALAGKPMEIKGKTVEGKDFSTADWKGKVVLVDFWATWCGPCVAELPRVKEMYTKYHPQGLEILGVSNDYSADDLTNFVKKENMAWPQLFDANAAKQQQWNPITTGFGINGIPTMFLIDKKGVCHSVTARDDMEKAIPALLAEK